MGGDLLRQAELIGLGGLRVLVDQLVRNELREREHCLIERNLGSPRWRPEDANYYCL